MKTLNLIQGTPEWHAHRNSYKNASDAPAMMGASKYKSRSQLIKERATGIKPEVDPDTQKRFDEGHLFEALARPLAEKIIGEELFPVTGTTGEHSASFDGLTMDERISFEHKRLNDELRACNSADGLPLMHRIQMEHQLMVSENTEKVLFMATNWQHKNGEWVLEEEKHFWYEPDLALREQVINGWIQLDVDIAKYVPEEVKAAPETKPAEAMPVPSISVRGEVTLSNLSEITPHFDRYLAETNTALTTDDHFAQADVDAKGSREAARNLKLTAKAVIDQIAPVSAVVRTLEEYATKFDALGLKLEKAVAQQKEAIKAEAIMKAKAEFSAHVQTLEEEILPIRLSVEVPDFAAAIKGVKTIATMRDRISTALAQGRGNAEAAARDIRTKLNWFNHEAANFKFLFNDLQQIISKPSEDLGLLVRTRIYEHQQEQDRKQEAERERLRAETDARAAAAQQAEIPKPTSPEPAPALEPVQQPYEPLPEEPARVEFTASKRRYFTGPVPSQLELVEAVATTFNAPPSLALTWLQQAEFSKFELKKAA